MNTSWIRKNLKDKNLVKEISPNHLTKKGLPPTLIIHGTNDGNCPYPTAVTFVHQMKAVGNDIEFNSLQNAGHFIWYDPKYTGQISTWRSNFLQKLGY
jgi:dipeptidyl aminopeptidase/acylaminoacyl peptidase